MKKFIYETNIPSWNNPTVLLERIALWNRADISTVFLVVDDGKGATWQSTVCPIDARVNVAQAPLQTAIDVIRSHGISVVLAVNVIGIVQIAQQIKPEYYLPTNDYYNFWNADFYRWRLDYLTEIVQQIQCDGIALDYIRTGRGALPEEEKSEVLVERFLTQARSIVPSHIPLWNISHTVYNKPNSQGVNYVRWYENGLIQKILVYNYSDQFPFRDVENLPTHDLWVLNINYKLVNAVAVGKTKIEMESYTRKFLHKTKPFAYGMYNANFLNAEQADVLKQLDLIL